MTFPYRLVDLTHTLHGAIPTWAGGCGFEHGLHHDYDTAAPISFRTHRIQMAEGIGTHMDAPAHCFPGAATVDDLPLEHLVGPCVVVDLAIKAQSRPDYAIAPQDILDFEKTHGPIPPDSFVLFTTGWSARWDDPEAYRNDFDFPHLSADAAQLLVDRRVRGVGLDTLSPDTGKGTDYGGFPVHGLLLGSGILILENVKNPKNLPPTGAYLLVLPLKIQGATEAPLRLVGMVPLK